MAPGFLRWLKISLFAISSLTASPQARPDPEDIAELSFVVLRSSEKYSLVRVSADGKLVTTIAHGAPGVGLAKDTAGNYVIAAATKLLIATPFSAAIHVESQRSHRTQYQP